MISLRDLVMTSLIYSNNIHPHYILNEDRMIWGTWRNMSPEDVDQYNMLANLRVRMHNHGLFDELFLGTLGRLRRILPKEEV